MSLLGIAALAAFLVSGTVLEVVLRWARTKRLDVPNERSSHSMPTPRGGGLAIIVAILLVAPLAAASVEATTVTRYSLLALMATLAGIASISWLDDRTPLPARLRLCVHLAMALVMVGVCMGGATNVPLTWRAALTPVLVFWVVGVTNAYNFMDGIDGIAGSQAVICGMTWMIASVFLGAPVTAIVGVVLVAAALAFLRRNWSPAAIFMGDVGSASLGFLIATLPMLFALEVRTASARMVALFAAVLALWPFLFDTTFTLVQRIRRGERITEAHRSHLYQRLVITGASHGTVSTLYGGLALTGALVALLLAYAPRDGLLSIPIIPIQALYLVQRVRSRESRGRTIIHNTLAIALPRAILRATPAKLPVQPH